MNADRIVKRHDSQKRPRIQTGPTGPVKPGATPRLSGWACCGLALLLLGCASPRPPTTPELPMREGPYRQAAVAAAPQAPTPDADTWRRFEDPVLEQLLARAREANLDVRIAEQRVRQARAGTTALASRLWPTVSVTSSASDQRSGLPADFKRGMADARAFRGALDIGWELDLAGAARAAAEGARADALAADAGVEVAQWLASTEVARQYLLWQGARVRLLQLESLLKSQEETERLIRGRQAQGIGSELDVARASGDTAALAAQLPPLRTFILTTEHQIDVLLGRSPTNPDLSWRQARPALSTVPAVSAGQPIELLERRPDMRVALHQLRAESARLRESQADQWPRLFLSAVLGQQDLRLNGINLAPVSYSNAALLFTAPVFNAGRLRAAVERQSARERTAALQVERAALTALQDVENSLVALNQAHQRHEQLSAVNTSRQATARHAAALHREGQIDRLQLLEAQRGQLAAELELTDSHTQRVLGVVQLIRALGGGWAATPTVATR
jgi:NodT family efflux transporter outer membrane factor (OMF) lipoprotein